MSEYNQLKELVLPQRIERLKRVLQNRVVSVTLVLENLHKDYNISAILRTCESFGIHEVHVVPQPGEGKVFGTVTQGCHKWLSIRRHDSVSGCLEELRNRDFKIMAGAFGAEAVPLESAEFSGRVALVFSNELNGASGEVLDMVDGFFNIPMCGFSRSLNVSVAAGIVIHHVLRYKREKREPLERLSTEEADRLFEGWVKKSVRRAEDVLMELRSRK